MTRDWRTVALDVLPSGAGRRRRNGELRDVAVVDVVGGVEGVHQDEAVHAGLDVRLLGRMPDVRRAAARRRAAPAAATAPARALTRSGAVGNLLACEVKYSPASAARRILAVAGLALVALAAAAPPSAVSGRVTMLDKENQPGDDVGQAVIWLSGPPAQPRPPVQTEIGTSKKEFSPHVLVVPVGSTVAFPNHDPFNHNVFSLSEENPFDLGLYGRGEARSVRFDQPGLVRVYCNVHAQMSALVLVRDSPWYTQPASDGSFTLGSVPPGELHPARLARARARGHPAARRSRPTGWSSWRSSSTRAATSSSPTSTSTASRILSRAGATEPRAGLLAMTFPSAPGSSSAPRSSWSRCSARRCWSPSSEPTRPRTPPRPARSARPPPPSSEALASRSRHPAPPHPGAGPGAGLRLPHRRIASRAATAPTSSTRPTSCGSRPAPTGCSSPTGRACSRPGPRSRGSFGEDFSRGALIGRAMEGQITQGLWLEPGEAGDELYQAVGVPVANPGSTTPFGVVVAALRMDSAFAAQLRRNTDSEIVFFSLDTLGMPQVAVSTLPREAVARAGSPRSGRQGRRTAAFARFRLRRRGREYAGRRRVAPHRRRRAARRVTSGSTPATRSWRPTGS